MEGWNWRDGCQDLEDFLGGLEDQGWCLACGEFGHPVVCCPYQEEEEELAQERKVRRRQRKGKGKAERPLLPSPPAEEECLLVLPPQPKWEEPERPQPKREEPERTQPKGEEPERPTPDCLKFRKMV
ncbi:UNVERIFIED_CONTAM: hypothetical protein FKN15_056914 [Acipenser sinensis]